MKIYLAASPGCNKSDGKKQEKFLSRIKAHRLFSFHLLNKFPIEKYRMDIAKGKKR